jgi:hypothetical protein
MSKILDTTDYVFTPGAAGAGTILFRGEAPNLENVQMVFNVTRGVTIYQPNSTARGSAGFSQITNTLTLDIDTSTHSASDVLQVYVTDSTGESDVFQRVGGIDPNGYPIGIRVNARGHVVPSDQEIVSRRLDRVGSLALVETTGYNSVVVQLAGTWAGTQTFEVSNDGTSWSVVGGWAVSGAASPVNSPTANGHWVCPCAGRFFRVRFSTFTSGVAVVNLVLKNAPAFFPASSPSIAANSAVNVAQFGATNIVTAGVAGIPSIGGNIAVGSAPTANPLPLAWDGTNTRRILTDASNGGVVLGSNAVTNGQTSQTHRQTTTITGGVQLKGSAGRLTMLVISQNATVAGFLHVFNASSYILGSTSDMMVYAVPATVGIYAIRLPEGGLFLSSGIGIAFTAGAAANDNTAFGSAPNLAANYSFI